MTHFLNRDSECVVCGEKYQRYHTDTDHICIECWMDEQLRKGEQLDEND